ncbi:plasma membrane transporter PNS1-like [Vairimorpha necatrix]|uniref:Protein PNS1 n=1 Tax=Vairimorpha necatrix TaxID=6039 RepID=A0AAX4JE35_9MICR
MNSSTANSQYIRKSRKFHDAWAFVLYAISVIGFSTFSILNMNKTNVVFTEILDLQAGLYSSGVVFGFLFFTFTCLRFFPEVFLKLILLCYPIGALLLVVAILKINNWVPSLYLILPVILFLLWAYVIYRYWKWLRPAAKITKVAVKIILKNLFTALFGLVLVFSVIVFQMFLIINMDIKNNEYLSSNTVLYFFFILNLFWTFSNAVYFFKVYITSVAAHHIFDEANSSLSKALKVTLFSLGSICLGGLVISIVSTIRFIINEKRDRNREERRNNLLVDILLCIAAVIFSLLEDILEFANTLTFPYIAIHGDSYSKSMHSAFELATALSPVGILGHSALSLVLNMIAGVVGFFSGFSIYYYLFDPKMNSYVLKAYVYSGGLPVIFFMLAMTTITSGFIGLVFIAAENSEMIDNKYRNDLESALSEK